LIHIFGGIVWKCLKLSSRRKRRALLREARMNLGSRQSLRRKLSPQWKIPLSLHPLSLRGIQPLREKSPLKKKVGTSPRTR
jgi:hypothetical protein